MDTGAGTVAAVTVAAAVGAATVGVVGGGVVVGAVADCSSSCIADTSDLRMRSERPTPRAASGSFFAPNNRMNAPPMINQCHQDSPPMDYLQE